jgi:hypothetical protein
MPDLICGHCQVSVDITKVTSEQSQLYIAQIPKTNSDGLEVFPLLCFQCGMVTDWASDPTNSSGNATDGIEYFETYKLPKGLKQEILEYALAHNNTGAIAKLTS